MQLEKDREVDAEHRENGRQSWANGEREAVRRDRRARCQPDTPQTPARAVDPDHGILHDPRAVATRFLEHPVPEPDGIHPAGAPNVAHGDRVAANERKVFLHERPVEQQVGTVRDASPLLASHPLIRRGTGVFANGTGAKGFETPRLCAQRLAHDRIGGDERVPVPRQIKLVPARLGHLLENVDAAADEASHRVVGPVEPVPVGLRALVARERHRRSLVDDDDVRHPMPDREMIGRRGAGHSGAAHDDFSDRHWIRARGSTAP